MAGLDYPLPPQDGEMRLKLIAELKKTVATSRSFDGQREELPAVKRLDRR
jgi:hypothetical protein